MKNFFDVLDRLYESGQPSMSEAISALQGEFAELSADAERAGRIFTAWRSGFGKTHAPKEGYASSEEAEALFLFGDFLRDLATNLASRGPKEKCGLCVFSNDSVCGDLGRSCYDGVEQYLLRQAAAYHQEMEACCKAYLKGLALAVGAPLMGVAGDALLIRAHKDAVVVLGILVQQSGPGKVGDHLPTDVALFH